MYFIGEMPSTLLLEVTFIEINEIYKWSGFDEPCMRGVSERNFCISAISMVPFCVLPIILVSLGHLEAQWSQQRIYSDVVVRISD